MASLFPPATCFSWSGSSVVRISCTLAASSASTLCALHGLLVLIAIVRFGEGSLHGFLDERVEGLLEYLVAAAHTSPARYSWRDRVPRAVVEGARVGAGCRLGPASLALPSVSLVQPPADPACLATGFEINAVIILSKKVWKHVYERRGFAHGFLDSQAFLLAFLVELCQVSPGPAAPPFYCSACHFYCAGILQAPRNLLLPRHALVTGLSKCCHHPSKKVWKHLRTSRLCPWFL